MWHLLLQPTPHKAYKGDLILNAAVLLAILLSYYGVLYADPLFAIGVAGYLLYNSWDIACESADHLMDKELPDDEKQSIFENLLNFEIKDPNFHNIILIGFYSCFLCRLRTG